MGTEGWRFTGLYGHPEAARGEETWRLLRRLSQMSSKPWLCAGDFNEILSQDEKTGALQPRRQIEDFRSCLAFCQLVYLGVQAISLLGAITARLLTRCGCARACATLNWQNMFLNVRVSTEAARSSDHNSLVIELEAIGDTLHKQ
ncbi:UNVERIFIED_CONTAM: hypothetical protein Slati_4496100 [Sesamum latifolium]|uniref:Endonuclease/exonuclease/phosphatase family protein n=1 Tax=Sesamum latifolium TaxID=2727402 RepID=A0AAW2ST92_9LAMI